jgi:hypothetical protein
MNLCVCKSVFVCLCAENLYRFCLHQYLLSCLSRDNSCTDHTCADVCDCVRISVYLSLCVCVCVFVCVCVCVCVCMYVFVSLCVLVCVHLRASMLSRSRLASLIPLYHLSLSWARCLSCAHTLIIRYVCMRVCVRIIPGSEKEVMQRDKSVQAAAAPVAHRKAGA